MMKKSITKINSQLSVNALKKEIVMSLDSQQQSSLEDLQEETVQEVLDMSVKDFCLECKEYIRKTGYHKFSVQDIVDIMVGEKRK